MLHLVRAIAWYPRIWWRQLANFAVRLPERALLVNVPYFSQFESPDLIEQFFSGDKATEADPNWATSGAETPAEYAWWAWHMCGMACFKMALAHATHEVQPLVQLAKICRRYGGYIEVDGQIDAKGLRYQPFIHFIAEEFGWQGAVMSPMVLKDIQRAIARQQYVIASVHPFIYQSTVQPPHTGGHLVLITGYDRTARTLTYQDPWGRPGRQANVVIREPDFRRFFAHRGIIFYPRSLSETE